MKTIYISIDIYICLHILNHVYLQHPEVPGKIILTSLEAWTVVLENCGVLRCCAGVWCVLMHWSVCCCTGVWCTGVFAGALVCGGTLVCGGNSWTHTKSFTLSNTPRCRDLEQGIMDFN